MRSNPNRSWLKLGFVSFGGPAGQIALMHNELVERRRWISDARFLHALNYCMLLPGPEAQQLATYLGWLMHRTWGGVVAGSLFVLPSLLILMLLSWLYMAYGSLPVVAGLFFGIKPAVAAIVLHAAHRMATRALRNPVLWAIAALSFGAIFVLKLAFPLIVLGAAGLGLVGGRWAPAFFQLGGGPTNGSTNGSAAARQAAPARLTMTTSRPSLATTRPRRPTPASAPGNLRGCWPQGPACGWAAWACCWGCRVRRARSRRWPGSSPRPRC